MSFLFTDSYPTISFDIDTSPALCQYRRENETGAMLWKGTNFHYILNGCSVQDTFGVILQTNSYFYYSVLLIDIYMSQIGN